MPNTIQFVEVNPSELTADVVTAFDSAVTEDAQLESRLRMIDAFPNYDQLLPTLTGERYYDEDAMETISIDSTSILYVVDDGILLRARPEVGRLNGKINFFKFDGDDINKRFGSFIQIFGEVALAKVENTEWHKELVENNLYDAINEIVEEVYGRAYPRCEECNEWVVGGWHSWHDYDGNYLCEECFSDRYVECDDCGEVMRNDDYHWDDIDERRYCSSCYREAEQRHEEDSRADETQCPECGTYHNDGNAEDMCDSCANNRPIIHAYSYKPTPRFFGKADWHLGFELEITKKQSTRKPNDSCDGRETIHQIQDEIWYFKRDGSLSDEGYEIVSHPLSFQFITENKARFAKHFETLKRSGMISYDDTRCGMHVHVGRRTFNSFTLYKMLHFFQVEKNFIRKISRRKSLSQMNTYARVDEDTKSIVNKAKCEYCDDRYTALNITRATIEFRIFQGTLGINGFIRNLEFVQAFCEFAKWNGAPEMTKEKFVAYVGKNRKTFPHLFEWLSTKGLMA